MMVKRELTSLPPLRMVIGSESFRDIADCIITDL
jgi:hypothetical protein